MTKKQKRIALAKDVLARLKRGDFTSDISGYCSVNQENGTCDVCAAGALAVACCGPQDMMSSYHLAECLTPFFSISQLALIEAAFECMVGPLSELSPGEIRQLTEASEKYSWNIPRTERMAKIMRNIVRNGKFVP